jgi:DNA-binding NarL/FixJ family response regulator
MKVLAIIANAQVREAFTMIVSETETCEMQFLNPHTSGPQDAAELVAAKGFDFIIFDFHAPIPHHVDRLNAFRDATPNTPILVFTLYHLPAVFAESGEEYADAKAPFYNQSEIGIWSDKAFALMREKISEARQLVA